MDPLTLAKKALEIAEADPDHVYKMPGDSCVYLDPVSFEGSCLFGRAFLALGVDPRELLARNTAGIEQLVDSDPFVLVMAQGAQDVGAAWGSPDVAGALADYIEARK